MTITKTTLKTFTLNATPERHNLTKEQNNKRHADYAATVSQAFKTVGIDGFTIQEVKGYWQGESERSYIITVATDKTKEVELVASVLQSTYEQDAVMLTYPDGTVAFIEA